MIQSTIFKLLLAPFSLLYGIIVAIRNYFYKIGLLKSIEFNVPVISVGNLSVGGAGKTPHIEYLIRSLHEYIDIATLSRGYKRKTQGYREVQLYSTAEEVGDEPLQFKRKFPEVKVVVSESRTYAIPQIMQGSPNSQLVLLDDAFQHRAVAPGLNILLTEYEKPFFNDYLLPSGRLREWRSAYQRADVVIASKCPPVMNEAQKEVFRQRINLQPHQQLFFSYYQYQSPYFLLNPSYELVFEKDMDVLLISAIAGTDYLINHLTQEVGTVRILEYEDHHYFTPFDMGNLKTSFNNIGSEKKVIVTTEKDAMRLELHRDFIRENELPIFVLPIEVQFHFDEGEAFDQKVKDYLLNFTV